MVVNHVEWKKQKLMKKKKKTTNLHRPHEYAIPTHNHIFSIHTQAIPTYTSTYTIHIYVHSTIQWNKGVNVCIYIFIVIPYMLKLYMHKLNER